MERYSPTGLYAVYCHTWTERYTNGTTSEKEEMHQEPVLSFNGEHQALICHHETGQLVRAIDADFLAAEEREPGDQVIFFWIKPGHALTPDLDIDLEG